MAVVGSHVRGAPGVTWWWKTSREGGQVGWCRCVPLGSERGDSIRGGGGGRGLGLNGGGPAVRKRRGRGRTGVWMGVTPGL